MTAVATAALLLCMGWSVVATAQAPRGLWPEAFFQQLQPQQPEEFPGAGEQPDNPLDRLDEPQLEALVARLRPGSAEARALADRLATRASNGLAERNWFETETDIVWILHLVPDHPEGLSLLARLDAELKVAAETDWPRDRDVVTPPERGARSLLDHQQDDLPGMHFLEKAGFSRHLALLLVWGVFWMVLLGIGIWGHRDGQCSPHRLGMVTALLACIALSPLAVPVWCGVFHPPGEHTWTMLIVGTFLSLINCGCSLLPPGQLAGSKSLPLVEDPEILSRVARLAGAIGVPTPPLRLWPSSSENQPTLAQVGRLSAPRLIISDGVLTRLDSEESDAVLANLLAHLANHSLWFSLLPFSAAAILAGQVSGAGALPAGGLGLLCLVGLRRLVSQPLEFDSDRRAALAATPQAMIHALEKIHVVHRLEGTDWLKRLCYLLAQQPSPAIRIARLRQQSGMELSQEESAELARGRWLGWMVLAVWLGAIVGGLALLSVWPLAAIPVGAMWLGLSLIPDQLEDLATRKIRRLNARRFAPSRTHWTIWLFWSLFVFDWVMLFSVHVFLRKHPWAPLISNGLLCLFMVLVGILLFRLFRKSQLQYGVVTAFTLRDHEKLVREFDGAPSWFRRDPNMDNMAALALALSNRRAEAIPRLEQLHAREPGFPAALMSLIALDYDEGNDARAATLAARLTELLPEDPMGPLRQILALVRLRRLDEAHAVLQAGRRRIPSSELLDLAEAALAIQDNQSERARELLETCDRRSPGDCLVATLWVEWYLRQSPSADNAVKTYAALERLETLVQSNPLALLDKTVERLRQQLPIAHSHTDQGSQPQAEWTSKSRLN
jgi:Zn-dependent protease with chaperone function